MDSLLGFELALEAKKSPKIVFYCFEKKRPLNLERIAATHAHDKDQHSGTQGTAAVTTKKKRKGRQRTQHNGKQMDHRIVGHSTAFAIDFDVTSPGGRHMAGLPPPPPAP